MTGRKNNDGNRKKNPKRSNTKNASAAQPPASRTTGSNEENDQPIVPLTEETNFSENNTVRETTVTAPIPIRGRPNYRSYHKRNPPKSPNTSSKSENKSNTPSISISSDLATEDQESEEVAASNVANDIETPSLTESRSLPKNNAKPPTSPMPIPGRPNYRSYPKRNSPRKSPKTSFIKEKPITPKIAISSNLMTEGQELEEINPEISSSIESTKDLPRNTQRDATATGILLPRKPNHRYYSKQKSKPKSPNPGSSFTENKTVTSSPTTDSVIEKPKKVIKVIKSNKFYDDESSAIPTYKTSSSNRGEVLIINNIMFEEANYRNGAEVDDENIEQLFKDMGFCVHRERNLKAKDMENRVKNFSQSPSLTTADISVLILMSHGTNNRVSGGYTEIFGSDDEVISTDKLLEYFTTENCPQMAHKPKIFIFQCCRGDNLAFIRCDAVPIKSTLKDMLIAYSTLPGFTSLRDADNGTWYIQTICDVFSQYAHQYHVEDLLKIVDTKLGEFDTTVRQTSSYESRGFKICFLHPV